MRTFGRIILTTLGTIATLGLTATLASADETHTVQPGDTLSEIATAHDVPGGWQTLFEWNGDEIDDPDLIFPGQEFTVSGDAETRDGRHDASERTDRDHDRESSPDSDNDSASSDEAAPAEDTDTASGDKVRPATGQITSSYLGGYRTDGGHSGTDFAGSDGNAYAAAAGTVVSGLWDGAYGNKLVISHGGGVETWYAHLAAFAVSAGEQVSTGQKIGNIGKTGNTTGPHLHFEVRINGEMTDPMAWLGKAAR